MTRAATARQVIDLQEEETRTFGRSELSEAVALEIYTEHGKRIDVSFPSPVNHQCFALRPKGCVGQIPLSSDVFIRIKPKVPIGNLFRMLEYAYNLKSFEFLEGKVSVDSVEDIFERLASVLAKMILDRARRGLYRGYIQDRCPLPYIRGRIELRDSIASQLRGLPQLHCTFEEHTADLDENRILAWTLYRLPGLGLVRDDVRRRVAQAFRVLAGEVNVSPIHWRHCVDRFYNRLNEDYRPMHALCRFFLENIGPSIESGSRQFLPFVVDMPILFESFVSEWLKVHAADRFKVKTQFRAHLDETGTLAFRIDQVLTDRRTSDVVAVLDTKYKSGAEPEESDIQQIVAYAVRMRTKRGLLVYPSSLTRKRTLRIGEVTVQVDTFDLSADLESSGRVLLNTFLN